MLHFWLPVLSNHSWIFEKKVLRFSFSLLKSFSFISFNSFFLMWFVDIPTLRPTQYSTYIRRNAESERFAGVWGGEWRQWSPENESAFVCLYCHNFCQPVLYLPTTVSTCHKLGLSERFVCSVCETWNRIKTCDSVRGFNLSAKTVPFLLTNADFIASLQKIEIESL